MAKRANDSRFPRFHDASTEKLLDMLREYTRVDESVNKPLDREEAVRDHREDLKHKYVQPHRRRFNKKETSVTDREEMAADVIRGLIGEGYGQIAPGTKVNEDTMNLYIADALGRYGINTYKELMQALVNEGNMDADNEQSLLNVLIRHVAESKHTEGRDLQKLRRTLETDVRHWDKMKQELGADIGKEYNASARGTDVMRDHDQYIRQQVQHDLTRRSTTYGRPRKRAA